MTVETSLRLFRERGYEATTMRLLATEAGVPVGNAYYWFPVKEHLVQELYRRLQVEHRDAVAERLLLGGTLEQRLRGTWLASEEARHLAVGLLGDVVDGSMPQAQGPVVARLPELLWLAWLGITLSWVYDDSPDSSRTRHLIERSAPLLARLVRLSRLPVLRGTVQDVLELVDEVRP